MLPPAGQLSSFTVSPNFLNFCVSSPNGNRARVALSHISPDKRNLSTFAFRFADGGFFAVFCYTNCKIPTVLQLLGKNSSGTSDIYVCDCPSGTTNSEGL
ncbi:hypothetical protein AVEN_65455-1 [Araneus ventricosus]|uniref:Uncharacterized protein n=1 Tax=Araneus ventricosus TaxID=182803 RepID=A0A4Y2II24_ARAVE|nr:hypothetical protein AVEN_65455-1 [Araneus ventricosus]